MNGNLGRSRFVKKKGKVTFADDAQVYCPLSPLCFCNTPLFHHIFPTRK